MSFFGNVLGILADRTRSYRSYWAFCEATIFKSLVRFVRARHLEVVAQYVQRLSDDPEGGILIVLMPPGGGKSMMIARALVAWVLGRFVKSRVLMVTNAMPLAESHGRAVREIIQSDAYRNTFDTELSPVANAALTFSLMNGSTFFGVGALGAAIGQRAEWIIIDDPIGTFEEAMSDMQMSKLWDTWVNVIGTRPVPGVKIILIQQRLSSNDLAGMIMRNPVEGGRKVTVCRLPMECDDPENDPLGRALGEPLWPEYWRPADMAEAKSDPYKWATLFQQRPPSDINAWCDPERVQTTPTPPHSAVVGNDAWRVLIGIDIANSTKSGDATVFAVIGFERKTGAMHLLDLYRDRVDHAISAEQLIDMVAHWKPVWIGIENDGKAFVSHLTTRARYRGVPVNVEIIPSHKSKETKAGALRAKISAGLLHIDRAKPWANRTIKELTMFPNALGSAVDDIVDALAIVARKTSAMIIDKSGLPADVETFTFPDGTTVTRPKGFFKGLWGGSQSPTSSAAPPPPGTQAALDAKGNGKREGESDADHTRRMQTIARRRAEDGNALMRNPKTGALYIAPPALPDAIGPGGSSWRPRI